MNERKSVAFHRRSSGKSVLPKLLKEFGFDEAQPKKEGTVIIIFDDEPSPSIYEAITAKAKQKPDEI